MVALGASDYTSDGGRHYKHALFSLIHKSVEQLHPQLFMMEHSLLNTSQVVRQAFNELMMFMATNEKYIDTIKQHSMAKSKYMGGNSNQLFSIRHLKKDAVPVQVFGELLKRNVIFCCNYIDSTLVQEFLHQ